MIEGKYGLGDRAGKGLRMGLVKVWCWGACPVVLFTWSATWSVLWSVRGGFATGGGDLEKFKEIKHIKST